VDVVHATVLWIMIGVPWLGTEKTFAIKHAVNAHKVTYKA
jgi:hypothetical protein